MDVTRRQRETARGEMAWLEAGAGWPVVLLHAFPLHAEMWRPQLERVPAGWRFIAPDLRGFGRTPIGAGFSGTPSLDVHAADVFALFDALAIDDAIVIGCSMGGYIAFAMYRQAPARLTGLVLADTRAEADTPEGRRGREQLREVLAAGGPAAVADQMLPKLLSDRADAALAAEVRAMIESNAPAGIDAGIVAMMERPDSTAGLPLISTATLIVVGELDAVTPPASSEAMQHAIPRSTLTVIPGAGHLSPLEQPAQFSRVLGDFLLARL